MYKQSDKADLGGADGDHNWTEEMESFEDDRSCDGKLTYTSSIGTVTLGFLQQDKQASRATNFRSVGGPTRR